MNSAAMHSGRRDMARELGQKLTAAQEANQAEVRRCEGALGVLAQLLEALKNQMAANPNPSDEVKAFADEVGGGLRNLKTTAEVNMVALRGKISAAERALDLCEEAFTYETGALKQVLAAAEGKGPQMPDDKGKAKGPRKVGTHPGAPVSRRRRQAVVASENGQNTRPQAE